MAKFNAELYLRLRAEESLVGPDRNGGAWGLPLGEPASALVAVGAISRAKALAILEDYDLASALRSEHGVGRWPGFRRNRPQAAKATPFGTRRVVALDSTIETQSGTIELHRLLFLAHETRIAVTWRPIPDGGRGGAAVGPRGRMQRPPHAMLVDDRGTRASAGFSGGGSGGAWDGYLTGSPALHPDTAWIELDGERIPLEDVATPSAVVIEEVTEADPAARYLWGCLATRNTFHGSDHRVEPAIAALVAAGAVAADDPLLDAVRAVDAAMPHGHVRMPSPSPPDVPVPQPWRALLTRPRRSDGPEGQVTVDAVTPIFDDFCVLITTLASHRDHWGIVADVSPALRWHNPRGRAFLSQRDLAWWAVDDRGEPHLGAVAQMSGDDSQCSAEIVFGFPLHPEARSVQVMPTADTHRAVITIELPWATR